MRCAGGMNAGEQRRGGAEGRINAKARRRKAAKGILRTAVGVALLALVWVPLEARATGFTDYGNDLRRSPPALVSLGGALRLRWTYPLSRTRP